MPSARQVSWSKVRVLVVAVAALSILGFLAYLLTGGTLFVERRVLLLYIPDATGLAPGSVVRVHGIDVGKVQSISFSGTNQPNRVVRLVMQVEEQYLDAIPTDSYAQLSSDTAIGDQYVDITRGRNSMYVRPGQEIIFRPPQQLMKTLDIEQFTKQLPVVNDMLSAIERGEGPVGQLVTTDVLYNQLLKAIGDFEKQLRQATDENSPVGSLFFTDELHKRLEEPLLRIEKSLETIQADPRLRSDAQYVQLQNQLAALHRSLNDVAAGSLIASDNAYHAWSRELGSLIQQVDKFNANSLFSSSELYDNLTGTAKQLRDTLSDFRKDPQKYLRFKLF